MDISQPIVGSDDTDMVTAKSALLCAGLYVIAVSFYANFVLPLFSDAPARTKTQKVGAALMLLPFVPTGLVPAVTVWLWLNAGPRDNTSISQSDFEMANYVMALGVFLWPTIILFPFMSA